MISKVGNCEGVFQILTKTLDEFHFPVVMKHVNALTVEMGDHLEDITEALVTFVQFS